METKTSVIVINYNTNEVTLNCIKSLHKNTKKINYEIILIDNASEEKIRIPKMENLKFIQNKKNLGFARANNQGMKIAKGEYILLLNSDTVIKDNVVYEMTEWMDKHKDVGVASCKLLNKDGTVQGTGGYFPTLLRVGSWMTIEDIPGVDKLIKPFHPKPWEYNDEKDLDWVTGAFMFIRKKVIKDIGGLDEDYFMYTEDTDFCYRAKSAGWMIKYMPRWSVIHLGGASSRKEYPIISEFKSIKLFYKKHYPKWQLRVLKFFLKVGAFLRLTYFSIINNKEGVHTYANAFKAA